jgi:hypothetical protein
VRPYDSTEGNGGASPVARHVVRNPDDGVKAPDDVTRDAAGGLGTEIAALFKGAGLRYQGGRSAVRRGDPGTARALLQTLDLRRLLKPG